MPRRSWSLRPCLSDPFVRLDGMFHCGAKSFLQVVVEVVAVEVLVVDLAEESCAHRDDSWRSSEVRTMMNQMLSAILPEKSHQVLPHSLPLRRSDFSKALAGAWNALHGGLVVQLLEPFPS